MFLHYITHQNIFQLFLYAIHDLTHIILVEMACTANLIMLKNSSQRLNASFQVDMFHSN